MSATGGKQRRLIATAFVAGFGALLVGAVTSRDAMTVAAGDAHKEAKAVSAHELAADALRELSQPVSKPSSRMNTGNLASNALRQSSLPASRRADVSQTQQRVVETNTPQVETAVQQMRLPPPPRISDSRPIIPVAAHELVSKALQQSTTPSSRRRQSLPSPSSAHHIAKSSVQRLHGPSIPVSTSSEKDLPRMSASTVSDSRGQRNATLSALRANGLLQGSNQGSVDTQQGGNQVLPPNQPGGAEDVQPPAVGDEDRTFGEEPEDDSVNTLFFLRSDTILLQPGEWQFDLTLQYSQDTIDTAGLTILNNNLFVGEVVRRQRILQAPLEIRLGVGPSSQMFVNVPFGWSNSELAFAGSEEFQNTGGIGDVSWGLTRRLVQGNEICPEILGTVAWSAPTGEASLLNTRTVPGTNLGEGFWTMRGDLLFIQNYDPVVIFYGLGYRHRFNNSIDGFAIDPGQHAFYRLGVGFAVNPQVTFSTAFFGNYIGSDVIDGVRVAGGIREPMSLRFAATVTPKDCAHGFRTIEPFVNVGLTETALDTVIGITWTR
ncbi:MAG: hypothetical protein MPJ50_09920 [Pirellulales bacterium]|nr:hypothetical protein [Pirellulales bacterium]